MKQHLYVTLTFILLLLSPSSYPQSPTYGDCQIFPSDSIFNTKITNAPVHQNSDRWLKSVGKGVRVHPDFGGGLYRGKEIGIPINYTDSQTPRYPVKFRYDRESDQLPYPLPDFVKIEGGAYGDGDRHLISFDTDECKLYELFHVFRRESGDWVAGSGAVFDLSKNKLRKRGWTSADAAGLPIYPFLVKYDEVKSGRIDHALRFTLKVTNRKYIWPATHFASRQNNNNLPPMGMRLRLKHGVDISKFSAPAQIIATALKEYGMILADNGGDFYISGEPNDHWDNNQLRDLKKLTTEDFEVVDTSYLMISPGSAATLLSSYEQESALDTAKVEKKANTKPKNKAKYITQFFVSNNGDDNNDGSSTSPWRTLQHAADLAAPGDYINVEKGIYKPFSIRKSGEPSKPITFYADNATIDGYLGSARDGIEIKSANHITIKGFNIRNAKRAGISAVTCSDITIEWNQITDSKVWGIFTGFCSNLNIGHNVTKNSQQEHGIYVSNTSQNISVYNNKTFLNNGAGIQFNADKNMGKEGIIKNAKIYNNLIYQNGRRGGSALNLDGVQNSKIFNNLLYDNHATGIALFKGDAGDGSRFNDIVHNTIVMPDTGRWCALFKNGSSNNRFMNNVCVSFHHFRGAISIDDSSKEGLVSDYNAFTPRFTRDGGSSVMNFIEWQQYSGQDSNSVKVANINQLFDYNIRNFTPLSSGPLIKNGWMLEEYDQDLYKKARPTRPDIGAINYN